MNTNTVHAGLTARGGHAYVLARAHASRILRAALLAGTVLGLSGCTEETHHAERPRPVQTVTVKHERTDALDSLVGTIVARDEIVLSFRSDGKMIERFVGIGEWVGKGQMMARLDDEDQANALRSAEATLAAAHAALNQARDAERRAGVLLKKGAGTKVSYDQAVAELKTAQSNVDSCEAQVRQARDRLNYTRLVADADGIVTAVGADAGEIVRVGQMIVTVASGEDKDAVFDAPGVVMRNAPADIDVAVALAEDPAIVAHGRVREVSPQADPVTRTFRVRVGLIDPPPAMRLGTTVTGRAQSSGDPVIALPAAALTRSGGDFAVWSVDPATLTVALNRVAVARHGTDRVIVASGLEDGAVVVTAGVHTLHEGQQVRLLEDAP